MKSLKKWKITSASVKSDSVGQKSGHLHLTESVFSVNDDDKSRERNAGGEILGIWPFNKRTRERKCQRKNYNKSDDTWEIMKTLNMTGTLTTERGRIKWDVKKWCVPMEDDQLLYRQRIIYRVGGALPITIPLWPPFVAYSTRTEM